MRYRKRTTRAPFRRKTYRRRSTFKKRVVRKRFAKKIHNVADTKKRNAMASTIPGSLTTPTGSVQLSRYLSGMVWCPTYMYHEQDEILPHARNTQKIFYRGFSDKITAWAGTAGDIYHRRIVFWTTRRFTFAAPLQSAVSPTTWFRPLTLLDYSDPDQNRINDWLFRGTFGVDWTNLLNAPVDSQRVRRVSDRVTKISAHFAAQGIPTDPGPYGPVLPVGSKRYNRSTFVNRPITYDDEESGARDREDPGSGTAGSPWSSERGNGNLYVYDIFAVNGATDTTTELPETEDAEYIRPRILIDSINYWREA